MARVTPAEDDRRPALTPADWATLSLLYAADGNVLHDADLPALASRSPELFERLSRLVTLELVDYDRRARAHYLNYDGFALAEGHEEEQMQTLVAIKEARAAQPAYQYTIGSLRWLLVALAGAAGLVVVINSAGSEEGRIRERRASNYTALDSATWVLIREELSRVRDSVSAQKSAE